MRSSARKESQAPIELDKKAWLRERSVNLPRGFEENIVSEDDEKLEESS